MSKAKILCVFLLSVFFLSVIGAADVTGIGYGKTEKEALTNSYNDLIKQFGTSVSLIDMSSSRDDGKGNVSSEMSTGYIETSSFRLIGQKETVEKIPSGEYKATTVLPMEALPQYEVKLNDLYETAHALYQQIQDSEGNAAQYQYLSLINTLRDYDSYRSVVLSLDSGNQSARKSIGISSLAVEAEYRSVLMKEINASQVTVNDLQMRSELGFLDMEGEKRLQEALAQLEATKQAQEELIKASQEEYRLRVAQMEQEAQAVMMKLQLDETSPVKTLGTDADTISSYINRIEGNRATMKSLIDDLRNEIRPVYNDYYAEANAKKIEIKTRPYEEYELYMGSPSEEAIQGRANETEIEVNKIADLYNRKGTAIYDKYYTQIMKVSDYSISLIEELNEKSFSLSSSNNEVSSVVEGFADAGFFYGTTFVTIGNHTFKFYFKIPYEAWTGEKIPPMSDYIAYKTYRESISKWMTIFENFPSIVNVAFNFTVNAKYDGNYIVTFKDYSIIRTDTEMTIVVKDRINQTDILSYNTSTVFGELMTNYESIVDMDSVKARYQKYVSENQTKTEEEQIVLLPAFSFDPNLAEVARIRNLPADWQDPALLKYVKPSSSAEHETDELTQNSATSPQKTEKQKKEKGKSLIKTGVSGVELRVGADMYKVIIDTPTTQGTNYLLPITMNIKVDFLKIGVLSLSATGGLQMFSDKQTDKTKVNASIGAGVNLKFRIGQVEPFVSGLAKAIVFRGYSSDNASVLSYGAEAGLYYTPDVLSSSLGIGGGVSFMFMDGILVPGIFAGIRSNF